MKVSKIIMAIVFSLISQASSAETYKCIKNGRTTYQAKPCGENPEVGKIEVKESTPEEKAEAQAKLQAIRAELDAKKAAAEQKAKASNEANIKVPAVPAKPNGAYVPTQ